MLVIDAVDKRYHRGVDNADHGGVDKLSRARTLEASPVAVWARHCSSQPAPTSAITEVISSRRGEGPRAADLPRPPFGRGIAVLRPPASGPRPKGGRGRSAVRGPAGRAFPVGPGQPQLPGNATVSVTAGAGGPG